MANVYLVKFEVTSFYFNFSFQNEKDVSYWLEKKEGGEEEICIDVTVFHLQMGHSYNLCEIHSLSVKLN